MVIAVKPQVVFLHLSSASPLHFASESSCDVRRNLAAPYSLNLCRRTNNIYLFGWMA